MRWPAIINVFFVIVIFVDAISTMKLPNMDNDLFDHPIVQTTNGKLRGKKLLTGDENKFPYFGFRGIPYAEPPIGDRRFKPPVPKGTWSGVREATKDSFMCLQPYNASISSEDCLYLNVYSPNLTANLPVMVWIHGGFFLLGTNNKTRIGPDYLIQENVVIVTVNYRVGIFGFLSTEDMESPGNYALKDQILALRWVQNNIKAFGGNPKNVTIFGESAGSACVSLLLVAKDAQGLYQGAIMESGVSLSLWSRTRNPQQLAFATGRSLGIVTTSTATLVSELRKVDAQKLSVVSFRTDAINTALTNPLNGLLFAPTIEPPHEGAVLTENCHEKLKRGDFNVVPIIVGYNSGEGNPFGIALSNVPLFMMKYQLDHNLLIPVSLNINESSKSEVGSQIRMKYFGNGFMVLETEAISDFITDDQFMRSTNEFVRLVSKFTPTFYYEFRYKRSNTDQTLPGAGHGEEVPFIWKTLEVIEDVDKPLRKKFIKMWTNFAKHSNPTPASDPDLDEVKWLPSNPVDFPYLKFNDSLAMGKNPRANQVKFWRNIFQTYGNPPYDTY